MAHNSEVPPYDLSQDQIDQYRRDGFIQLDDLITGAALESLRAEVEKAVAAESQDRPTEGATLSTYEKIFNQKVNLWTRHEGVAPFVLSKSLGQIAARLEGVDMRVWHDQALFKEPGKGNNKTPWHQDAVYWPHQDKWRQTTIWIALRDATTTNGCMAFVPGTHALGPLPTIDLADPNPRDLLEHAAHLQPIKPAVRPLKAGSVTFHSGLTFHYAGPNKSDDTREAFAIIYMPEDTRFDGAPHVITDELALTVGSKFDDAHFPLVS